METHDFVSFKEAAAHLPGRPSLATLHRWRLNGVGGVKLHTVKVGGKRFVSMEELRRFVDKVTGASGSTSSLSMPASKPSKRSQVAEDYCRAEGL